MQLLVRIDNRATCEMNMHWCSVILGVCSGRVGCVYGRCGNDDGEDGSNREYVQNR